jgi:hypothetical protein
LLVRSPRIGRVRHHIWVAEAAQLPERERQVLQIVVDRWNLDQVCSLELTASHENRPRPGWIGQPRHRSSKGTLRLPIQARQGPWVRVDSASISGNMIADAVNCSASNVTGEYSKIGVLTESRICSASAHDRADLFTGSRILQIM